MKGTARAVVASLHGADMGARVDAYDDSTGLRVCAKVFADSGVMHRAAQAAGWASVIGSKAVDIVYPDPNAEGDWDLQP